MPVHDLPDTADIVRKALLFARGALGAAAPGTVVIDGSTIRPDGSTAAARSPTPSPGRGHDVGPNGSGASAKLVMN